MGCFAGAPIENSGDYGVSGVEFQSGFHRGGSAAKLVLDAQKEGKDIETSDLCVRIEALEAFFAALRRALASKSRRASMVRTRCSRVATRAESAAMVGAPCGFMVMVGLSPGCGRALGLLLRRVLFALDAFDAGCE